MKLKSFLVGYCLFLYSGQTLAALITYDYSFDTPQFNENPFGPVNDLLQLAGSTITGSITLDTDNIGVRNPIGTRTWDGYAVSSGGLTHSGELDLVGFDTQASVAYTPYLPDNPGTILNSISGWTIQDSDEIRFDLTIDFEQLRVAAQCSDLKPDPDDIGVYDACIENGSTYNRSIANYRPLTNLSLAQVPASPSPVPVPAAVWLFGTALIGLVGFSKRRKSA